MLDLVLCISTHVLSNFECLQYVRPGEDEEGCGKKQLPFLTTKDFKYNERHKNVHTYLKSQIILEDLNENLTWHHKILWRNIIVSLKRCV